MTQLRPSSIEWVEAGQPPLVRCVVFDVAGVRHEFVEKLAIVSTSDTLPDPHAAIACSVLDVTVDAADRRVVKVDTACPWSCETVEGLTVLSVFEHQLVADDDVWIAVDGGRISAARIGTNSGLNYGRFLDDALVYQAVLPVHRLDWYAPEFMQLVDELREDDERCGDTSPFAAIEYRRTLAEAAALPDALARAIRGYCDRELLDHHFPFEASMSEFVINSTDAVFVVGGEIILRGRCVRRSTRTAGQME